MADKKTPPGLAIIIGEHMKKKGRDDEPVEMMEEDYDEMDDIKIDAGNQLMDAIDAGDPLAVCDAIRTIMDIY